MSENNTDKNEQIIYIFNNNKEDIKIYKYKRVLFHI